MKDKIKQAGYKTQKECALHLSLAHRTVLGWTGKPEKAPKWFSEYLDIKIESIRLKSDLNVFKGYFPDNLLNSEVTD